MRRSLVPALAVTGLLLIAAPAGADLGSDLADVEKQIDDLEAAVAAAEGTRTEFVATVLETARLREVVAAELVVAEQELADTENAVVETETLLADLIERMDARQGVILRLRADTAVQRQAAAARAVAVYISGHAGVSGDFAEAGDPSRVGMVYAGRVQNVADQVIAEYELYRFQEQQNVKRLEAEQAEADVQRVELKARQAAREAVAVEVAARVTEVEVQLAEQKELLARMKREIAHSEGEITDLARHEDLIRALIAQELTDDGTAPEVLLRPVPGGVSSGFGWRIHPIYGDSRLHTGWDLNAPCGEPIVAGAAGRVFQTGWKGGYGNTVMIDHGGGVSTLYAHQSSIAVVYDEQVTTGQVVGWIGTTGTSTACHLHWEVRVNAMPVDPGAYM